MDNSNVADGVFSLNGLQPLSDYTEYKPFLEEYYKKRGWKVADIKRDVLAYAHQRDMLDYAYSDMYIFYAFMLRTEHKQERSRAANENDPTAMIQILPSEYHRACRRAPLQTQDLPALMVGPFARYARPHIWSFDAFCANLK